MGGVVRRRVNCVDGLAQKAVRTLQEKNEIVAYEFGIVVL